MTRSDPSYRRCSPSVCACMRACVIVIIFHNRASCFNGNCYYMATCRTLNTAQMLPLHTGNASGLVKYEGWQSLGAEFFFIYQKNRINSCSGCVDVTSFAIVAVTTQ